jgi:hypothetical protein
LKATYRETRGSAIPRCAETINTATVPSFAQAIEVAEAILAVVRSPVGPIAEELTRDAPP